MEKMIFTLTEQMKDAIQLLQRTVTVKKGSGGVYPEGVLFYKDNLAAISSDLSITYKLTSDETGFVPQLFEKKVIVPIKGLQLIMDSAENSEITLSVENNILSVKKNSKRGIAQIALTTDEFPEIPKLDIAGKDSIPVKEFLHAIKTTSYAMAKNSSKPLLMGMHMISDGNTLTIYAIDGFRISLWTQPYVSDKFTISIPAKTVDKLTSALSKASGDLTVVRCNGGRQAAFVIGKLVIRSHLLYGDLIDLSTIVKDKKSEVEVEKLPCLSILKTVSMLQEDRKNPVRVSLANDKIVFNYRGANSQYEDECAVSAAESAESVMIGLNNSYLQDTLNACPADTLKVQYDGALSPVLFRSKSEQAEIVQVVVPMRLAAE
ncbi:MAG: hypothetical protein UIH27_02185 [Ruminococcus sp.]|nr:hypothetical protein [Ruminococcus sp.]